MFVDIAIFALNAAGFRRPPAGTLPALALCALLGGCSDDSGATDAGSGTQTSSVLDAQPVPFDALPGPSDAGLPEAGSAASDAASNPSSALDGGSPPDAAHADSGASSDAGRPPAQACLASASLVPGETNRTLEVAGVSRSYLLHVPPGYTGKAPVPLVIDWHGLLLDGATQRLISGYAEVSDTEGFIVAFPDGIDNAWNIGPCCTSSRDVDDLAFARALVAEIERLSCIDPKRVYAVGFSMGGGMSHYLACNAGDLFAAVAPAAFDLLAADEEPCHPSRPITVISFRSRDDLIVPYEGGASNPPNGLPITIHFRGAQATFEFWKQANGCTGASTTENGCETYASCAAGVQTTLCTADGAGGHIPGDPELGWATLKRYTLP